MIGKWHLGGGESHPTKVGYDYFMGLLGGGCSPKNPPLEVDGKKQKLKGFTLDILTEAAMKFLENRPKDKPFMLSLHYRSPHGAYLPVRDKIWDQVKKNYPLPDFPALLTLRMIKCNLVQEISHTQLGLAKDLPTGRHGSLSTLGRLSSINNRSGL